MKVLVLCNSDTLSLPIVQRLKVKGNLCGVGITSKSSLALIPKLKSIGVEQGDVCVLDHESWQKSLADYLVANCIDTVWVITFPWIIPVHLLSVPPKGFVNFHFGLLPKYAGNDPVFWQLKNMEKEGGITVHLMSENVDEGPILLKEPLSILPGETYGLHCSKVGASAVSVADKVLALMESGGDWQPQESIKSEKLYFKKPSNLDLTINWSEQSADEIEWLVNASNPKYGGACTSINGMQLFILEVTPATVEIEINVEPGTIIHADVIYGIVVACINQEFLRINIARINEGYVSGVKLFNLGFFKGHKFE